MQNTFARLVFLIQVSRPIIWPVLPLVYALGLNSAHAEWTPVAIAQMVLLTFPMNLIGCGLNDIYDYESDRLSTRRRTVWGAVVDEENRALVWQASIAMMPLVFFGAVLTGNADNIVAATTLLLGAFFYSVPPVRLKERPPLDSIANGLGYFLLPFTMGYSLGADPRAMPLRYYLLSLSVCGIHALAAAADYEADRRAGHQTLAVKFGRRAAAAMAFVAFAATWLLSDFHGMAVKVYVGGCSLVALLAMILPSQWVIYSACVAIFGGFLVAGALHLAGW